MLVDPATRDRRNDVIARLGVLDRAGDPGLTALTRLATYISGAPGAAVNILDDVLQRRIAATGITLDDHPREDTFCKLVVDSEQRITCADATRDPRFGYSSFVKGDAPVRFYAAVPLRDVSGVVIGTLCTFDTVEHDISAEQLDLLADLADQAATQLELTRLAVELGDIASRDPLTGAVNRLVLGDRLAQAFARRARRGGETFLALLDVDHFKAVNDQLGHDAGDRVLITLVDRLHGALRPEDTIARLGGDEFVVLAELPNEKLASELAARITAALMSPIELDDGAHLVRTSVGCVLAQPDEPMRELLARADAAMYERKSRRRAAAA